MNVGILLKLVKEATGKLEAMGLLNADGSFTAPTPEQDAELAVFVEAQLSLYGVTIPDKVLKVTQLLPFILQMAK